MTGHLEVNTMNVIAIMNLINIAKFKEYKGIAINQNCVCDNNFRLWHTHKGYCKVIIGMVINILCFDFTKPFIQNSPVQNFGSSDMSPQSSLPLQYLSNGKQIWLLPLHGNSDILHDLIVTMALIKTMPHTISCWTFIICKKEMK